jgi:hypothetical protein
MKLLKCILILFITITITSCGDEEGGVPLFGLSNANIAGTYNINSLSLDTKVTSVTVVSGISVPFTVATSTSTGDTFQVDFVLNVNGTYTASGQYRVVSTITPAVGNPLTNNEIINFTDSGSYQLNTINNTITLTPSTGDFIEGILNIVTFNETTVSLTQELEEEEDLVTTKVNAAVSFTRQ